MSRTPLTPRDAAAALVVAATVALVYAPAYQYDFVHFDDYGYVHANPQVVRGLSGEGLLWAFTTTAAANWHPLTWVSLQSDAALWGLNPAGYHLTNVLIHAANAALVYLVLVALTGARGRSLFVAALWGLHPLRVESVAWVAERKDLLCGFFWLLTTGAYLRYSRCPSRGRFLPVVLGFALALLAKPMAVTLPCALLLLDAWPLGRLRSKADLLPRIQEKVVLFALAGAACGATFYAQAVGGAVRVGHDLSPGAQAANVVLSYATYLRQSFWPTDLAAFYPLHLGPPVGRTVAAGALLLATTALAVALRRVAPYLLVGCLWFLGTLIPVIGVVHVGEQSHADRYTYLPHVGLFLAVIWGVADLCERLRVPRAARLATAVVLVAACATLTRQQLPHWQNGRTLWERVIAVTPDCSFAWCCLGRYHLERDDTDQALRCADEALRLNPDLLDAEILRGRTLYRLGRWDPTTHPRHLKATGVPDG